MTTPGAPYFPPPGFNPPGSPIQPLNFRGVIPVQFSTAIIEEAVQQSAALQLGNQIPMGTRVSEMPVPSHFPKAAWSTTDYGARKPYTDLGLKTQTITAEEVAAVVAIPDAMVEDSEINLWNWVRPRLAEAIASAIDDAIFFGTDAPPTFPSGGLVAHAQVIPPGMDAVDTVNQAMSAVETQGLRPTGHAMDIAARGTLRGVRDANNALLLGTTQVNGMSVDSMYGAPITYHSFSQRSPDFITGAWQNLLIGVRSDIRYDMNPAAVLADDQGRVIISGFQDNMLPMKVWARFGCTILDPVTLRVPGGAKAFAVATLAGTGPGNTGGGSNGSGGEEPGPQSAAAHAGQQGRGGKQLAKAGA